MITTSISQSKRLLEAGIDSNTADMHHARYFTPFDDRSYETRLLVSSGNVKLMDSDIPAWSLSALITLCPEHVPYRIIRTRGKDIEGIFEDLVEFLCRKK